MLSLSIASMTTEKWVATFEPVTDAVAIYPSHGSAADAYPAPSECR